MYTERVMHQMAVRYAEISANLISAEMKFDSARARCEMRRLISRTSFVQLVYFLKTM